MKKYYMMAIEKDNVSAMLNLSLYYKNIENNNELAKQYLLMDKTKHSNKISKCFICIETKQLYYLSCNKHSICDDCLINFINKPCPLYC